MRAIPSALQAKLDSGVTTLCRCWVVTRADGQKQGFTDHDEDILLDGVTCRAGTGLSASEATAQSGLAVTASEIAGALNDEALTEDDLAAGLYDAAAVEVWLVDWTDAALRLLLSKGTLGEVRREGAAFVAEVRGLADRLAEQRGRLYTAACSADLGDARCTVDLNNAALRGTGAIATLTGTSAFTASGLESFDDGWFTAGRLAWTSGANDGLAMEVKRHSADGGTVTVELWQAMAQALSPGDAFTVTAGCDKKFSTCRDRFANSVNFRGFPHIPGNDFVVRYPVSGEP
ncbi:MAG: DUF2163 domain-containing protein, partial [Xanthobacteraceae bacterium]